MSCVPENFYVQSNTLEERDGHQNVCSPITELSLEDNHAFAQPLAFW